MVRCAEDYQRACNLNYPIPNAAYERVTSNLVNAPFDLVSTLGGRMTGKIILDAVVAGYGNKGTGKSEGDLYVAERLGCWLGRKFNQPSTNFFTMDNVRSVDPSGTLKMFTSKQLIERPNQVLVIDDASIASNARNFYSEPNKRLNAIITVARIYRHCVLLNTISSNLIDAVLAQFADYVMEFEGPDPTMEINYVKFFRVEHKSGRIRKGGREPYHKYMQFYDRNKQLCQITRFMIGRPSLKIREEYGLIRKEKTDALVMDVFDDGAENVTEKGEKRVLTKAEKKKSEIIKQWKDKVRKWREEDPKVSIKELGRRMNGIHESRVNQVLAAIRLEDSINILDGKKND